MMNSNALFGMALVLPVPWQITDVDFKTNDPERRELHLQIGFTSGSKNAHGSLLSRGGYSLPGTSYPRRSESCAPPHKQTHRFC